jgi:hypothetical protein
MHYIALRARLCVAFALAFAALGVFASVASASYESEYENGVALGTQAYVYGYPLVDTNRVFETNTSANVCDERGDGPVNRFCAGPKLAEVKDHTVVSPNHDTLYDNAWVQPTAYEPLAMRIPNTGTRFEVAESLSPWTENFSLIGVNGSGFSEPGNYVIVPPGYGSEHGLEAIWHPVIYLMTHFEGFKLLELPYSRAWIIDRVEVYNEADTANVNAIQKETRLEPLIANLVYGWNYTPPPPHTPVTTPTKATIPGTQSGEDPLAFFDALDRQMQAFPPQAADKPLLEQLASVGIAPSAARLASNPALSTATLEGLRHAVQVSGPTQVGADEQTLFKEGFGPHNGWLVEPTGNYGTNYALRAVVDKIGLGAPKPNQAIYPAALTDRTGAALTGTKRYVIHFNAPGSLFSQLPIPFGPHAFWSMTLYNNHQFFVPNPINRYVLNDRSALHYEADGSLNIYLQPSEPKNAEQAENWLPLPPAGEEENPGQLFSLITRIYGPPADDIEGILNSSIWKPPTVLPCATSGSTPAFPPAGISAPIPCAE